MVFELSNAPMRDHWAEKTKSPNRADRNAICSPCNERAPNNSSKQPAAVSWSVSAVWHARRLMSELYE